MDNKRNLDDNKSLQADRLNILVTKNMHVTNQNNKTTWPLRQGGFLKLNL